MPHIHEKIDFVVGVFVVYENTVLLRFHEKLHTWLAVGGHIELDEDPQEAAIREAKEETGLDITLYNSHQVFNDKNYRPLATPQYMGRSKMTETHEHIDLVYFAKSETDVFQESVYEHEKNVEMKWFTREELEKTDILENIKFYALKALETLKDK